MGAGFQEKAAVKIESSATTYPASSPAVCGEGDLLEMAPGITINQEKVVAPNNTMDGENIEISHTVIGKNFTATIPVNGTYDSPALMAIIVSTLGFEHGTLSPQSKGDGVYKHLFEHDVDLAIESYKPDEYDGTAATSKVRQFTLCVDKSDAGIWEYISSKIQSLTISGSSEEGVLILSADILSYNLKENTRSQYNTSSADWTRFNLCTINYKDMNFRMRPVYEFTITNASNDTLRIYENATDNIDVDITAGTYSGERLALLIQDQLNEKTENSIVYEVNFNHRLRKFELKNTNNSITFTTVIASSLMSDLLGFNADPVAALKITGQLGAQPDYTALDSNDILDPMSFSITIPNNLRVDRNSSSGELIDEPTRDAKTELSGEFQLSTFKNTRFIEGHLKDTAYYLDIRFSGKGIADNECYEFNILGNEIKLIDSPDISAGDASVIEPTYNMRLYNPEGGSDVAPGWSQEDFLIQSSLDSAIDKIYGLAAFKGKNYALTGDTDALLMEYNPAAGGGWSQSFHDATGYQKILAGATFNNLLLLAMEDDAGTAWEVFSWDGTPPVSLTDLNAGATSIINTVYYSNVFGKIYIGEGDGTITDYDGTTWTSRDTDLTDGVHGFTEANGTLYACGGKAGVGKIRKSTDGTTFADHVASVGSDVRAMENRDGYIYASIVDTTDVVKRYDDVDTTGTAVSNKNVVANALKWNRGNLYIGYADGVIATSDGHNSGSFTAIDTTGDTAILSFNTFRNELFAGTEETGDASVFLRRPFKAINIENQNTRPQNILRDNS